MNPQEESQQRRARPHPVRRTRRINRCYQCGREGCNRIDPRCPVNRRRVNLSQYVAPDIDRLLTRFNEIRDIVYFGHIKNNISVTIEETNEEAEECGICYENQTSITTNCGHKYCTVCVQNHLKSVRSTKKPCCAFCRTTVTQLKAVDASSHEILTAFIK